MNAKKILIAEDHNQLRDLVQLVCTRNGYEARAVEDGVEAYQTIKSGYTPDLLITDYHMPRMTGLQLVEELKASGYTVPVLFMSAHAKEEDVAHMKKFGPVLQKPVPPNVLASAIKRALGDDAQASSPAA